MGLDTTHDCWHGPYSAFMRWRSEIAAAAGFPPLQSMEGFAENGLSWAPYEKDPLAKLLYHSDCDGSLLSVDCGEIAVRLTDLLPKLGDDWIRRKTELFIAGLRKAYADAEDVKFH